MMGWGNMMGGWGNGGYGGGYGMMGIGMHLVLGIGFILLIIYLFRRSSRVHTDTVLGNNRPMDILSERYARGEIDSREYQSRKQDLKSYDIIKGKHL
ncbi:membrane protein [Desulfosporosinus sp. HMP52]|uniref:SHOCT domain-containing protein n=1 Tax=Desulfosporosinus sp. HMP52 TaxID=1487923 RepID=UPI00051FC34E|nr:SHOCT domain-containing protein [Desulfosporosinus sp. HMP52]KGK89153.1 membrane protein [Desulfosporosinus sp. HMP52]